MRIKQSGPRAVLSGPSRIAGGKRLSSKLGTYLKLKNVINNHWTKFQFNFNLSICYL